MIKVYIICQQKRLLSEPLTHINKHDYTKSNHVKVHQGKSNILGENHQIQRLQFMSTLGLYQMAKTLQFWSFTELHLIKIIKWNLKVSKDILKLNNCFGITQKGNECNHCKRVLYPTVNVPYNVFLKLFKENSVKTNHITSGKFIFILLEVMNIVQHIKSKRFAYFSGLIYSYNALLSLQQTEKYAKESGKRKYYK